MAEVKKVYCLSAADLAIIPLLTDTSTVRVLIKLYIARVMHKQIQFFHVTRKQRYGISHATHGMDTLIFT